MKLRILSIFLLITFNYLSIPKANSQCLNNTKYPVPIMQAPVNQGDTILVTPFQLAGDYYEMNNFQPQVTYTFATSNEDDFITLRSVNNADVIAFGNNPLSFTIDLITEFTVHINLQTPICGTDGISRNSFVYIPEESEPNGYVGINTNVPVSTLDVNGKVKLGDDEAQAVAGMIRYNETSMDFEGYNGEKWLSLTKTKGSWGPIEIEAVNESEKITPSDTTFYKHYGASVDLNGDLAVVGAFRDSINGLYDVGAAYAYKRVNGKWVEQIKLMAMDGEENDVFGFTVAIGNDLLAIGAHGSDINNVDNAGAVYIYQLIEDTWVFQEKLVAPVIGELDNFGFSVAIDGTHLVVGAPSTNVAGVRVGKTYVYNFDGANWILEAELLSSDGVSDSNFGVSVDIYENTIIVGDYTLPSGMSVDVGAAYIYTYENNLWGGEVKLTDAASSSSNFFGSSVSVGENYAVVSSPERNNGFNFLRGSAFVFSRANNWAEDQMIRVNGSSSETSRFAQDVAIDDGVLVIGNNKQDRNNKVNQGASFVYQKNAGGWQKVTKLLASDGAAFDKFGSAVCIDNNTIIIGAQFDELILEKVTGSAYIFNYCK